MLYDEIKKQLSKKNIDPYQPFKLMTRVIKSKASYMKISEA
jgi:hypothetical protein